jgi:hypothetical protein
MKVEHYPTWDDLRRRERECIRKDIKAKVILE